MLVPARIGGGRTGIALSSSARSALRTEHRINAPKSRSGVRREYATSFEVRVLICCAVLPAHGNIVLIKTPHNLLTDTTHYLMQQGFLLLFREAPFTAQKGATFRQDSRLSECTPSRRNARRNNPPDSGVSA